jgi:hypothetical protein
MNSVNQKSVFLWEILVMPLRPHAEDKNLNMLHLEVIESQTCQCNTKQKKIK